MVIIIKLNKIKFIKSIKFKLVLSYLFVGILPLLIFVMGLISSSEKYFLEEKTTTVETEIYRIVTRIRDEGNFEKVKDPDSALRKEIIDIGERYGRIIVLDKESSVILDTNNTIASGTYYQRAEISEFIEKDIERTTNYIEEEERLQSFASIKLLDSDERMGTVIMTASTEEITDIITQLSNQAIILFFIILIVVSSFGYYFADVITRPFKVFVKSIKEVSKGHYDENIDISANLEIEEIATEFNLMTDRLEEIDASRKEFVSNVSHELKTPLTSIKVLAESLLSQKELPVEMYVEFLEDINNEIEREDKIINDLLSLVKVDKNKSALNIEKICINELLELLLRRLSPIAAKRNIEIIYESNRKVLAEVDEVKLSLAITNLIENAIKYNNDNGKVKVTLDSNHKNFTLIVEDSGVGIPDELKDKIFERFYRVDKARSRDTGGTGLGLAITKNTILSHKGNIKVENNDNSVGTKFTVTMPIFSELKKI